MAEWSSPRAVILAAGRGRRMGRFTTARPKCLLEVGGCPLILRQLASLRACGIALVTVVVGYRADRVRAVLGDRVDYIDNRRYDVTNSLYSLWLARQRLVGGGLILNADVLVPTALIRRLLNAPAEDAVLVDLRQHLGAEEMKVTVQRGHVVDFGKDLVPEDADGENVGIAKFGAAGARALIGHLEALVAAGAERAWAPLAFRAFARWRPLAAVSTGGLPWTEIDVPDDLERARREVAPAIAALERGACDERAA